MDMPGGFWAAVYVLLSFVNVGAAYIRKHMLFCTTKSVLMLVLLGVYASNSTSLLLTVMLALFFAWSGDVLLLYRGNSGMVWGGLAFLFCHLFYIWTFWLVCCQQIEWQSYMIMILFYVFIGDSFYANFIRNSCKFPNHIKFGIGIYIFAILSMSFSSLLILSRDNIYTLFPFIGSLLFIYSDYLFAVGYLVKNSFNYNPGAMSGYLTGQMLLVGGLIILGF